MPIQTRADYELIQNELRSELEKPEDQQDLDFMRSATAQLRAAENQFGTDRTGTASTEAVEAGVLQGTEAPVQPVQRQVPGQGYPVTVSPQQQLGTRALIESAQSRFRELGDFFSRLGMSDEEAAVAAENAAQREATTQLQLEEAARQAGVDPSTLKPAQITGELAADATVGAGPATIPLRTAGGALARIAAETAAGGVLGGSAVPLDQDLDFANTGLPAIGSGVLGSVAEIPMLGRNFVFSETRAALNSDAARLGREVEELTGISLSPAELSSNQGAARAEASIGTTAGRAKDNFLNNRQREIAASFDELDATLNPTRLSTGTIIEQTKEAVTKRVGELRGIAGDRFRTTLHPAADMVGATIDDQGRIIGGDRIVPVDNLLAELKRQRELAGEALSGVNPRIFDKDIAELETLQAQGGLTLGELQRRVAEFTTPSKGVVKDAARARDNLDDRLVLKAIFSDMDATQRSGALPADVVDTLQAARTQYAADITEVKKLESTATERLIDKVVDTGDQDFAQRIMALPEKEFTQLMRTLDDYNPGASRALRGRVFFEMVDKHSFLDPRTGGAAVDVPKLIGEFNRLPISKLRAFTGTGLDAAESARLNAGLLALQKIAQGPQNQSASQSILKKIEDASINLVSQSGEFLTRFLAGQLSPGAIERMVYTKAGQRSLMALGDPRIGPAEFSQSLNFILGAMREDDERVTQLKQKAQDELNRSRTPASL